MLRARIVDVSEHEPPRPMEIALESLRGLAADEYLVFRHRREPFPLYPMLTEMGFTFHVRKGSATPIEVVIWAADGVAPDLDE